MRLTNIKQQIAEHFFRHPTATLRVREIERTLNLSLPSVIRYCKELEQEGILTTLTLGRDRYYTAARSEDSYRLEKQLFNLRQLHTSGLIEHLKQELSNPPIILFGSYAKGEDVEESDIDLYIETLAAQATEKLKLRKYEKKLQRRIELFCHKRIREVKNPHLANNIINGITLNGQLEVFG